MSELLPLAVTMGDPAGCGPAITRQLWRCRDRLGCGFFVVADAGILEGRAEDVVPVRIIDHPDQVSGVVDKAMPVMHLDCVPVTPGVPEPTSAQATIESIRQAVSLVKADLAGAVVTNPVNKALLARSGFAFSGHTEYLAHLVSPEIPVHPVMMLVGGGMRIALVTIHMSLRDAVDALTGDLISETVRVVASDFPGYFGVARPRLALAALNPHAGESGAFGSEDAEILVPTVEALRSEGIDISGPHPADSLFHHLRQGQYDAAIALYHDQGLIPIKTVDFWNGVNTTLGLGLVRASPDHGVAYDHASDARADSLIAAASLAVQMAGGR